VDLVLKVKAGSYNYLVRQLGSGNLTDTTTAPKRVTWQCKDAITKMQVPLVSLLIKGLNQQVSIARVTLSQGLLGQPHTIVMVKVWEPNMVLVVGAPTLALGTLSTN
jgi:hypothetical protein